MAKGRGSSRSHRAPRASARAKSAPLSAAAKAFRKGPYKLARVKAGAKPLNLSRGIEVAPYFRGRTGRGGKGGMVRASSRRSPQG